MCRSQIQVQLWSNGLSAADRHGVLPDLGFSSLPAVPGPTAVLSWSDIWTLGMILITVVRFSVFGTRMRLTLMRRYLSIYSCLILLRSLCIITTLLPNPFTSCTFTFAHNPWVEALLVMSLYERTCADVLFSGHTVDLTMCALVWYYYSRLSPLPCDPTLSWQWWQQLFALFFAGFGFFLLVATHLHYTVDVVIAFVLTMLLWHLYHLHLQLLRCRCTYRLHRVAGLLWWLELGAEDLPAPSTEHESRWDNAVLDI
eukprot:RCo037341